jgi:hypothetical protein
MVSKTISVSARISAAVALAALLASAGVRAHHSFSAEFDVGRPVEITGTVTEIEWTNPLELLGSGWDLPKLGVACETACEADADHWALRLW